MWYQGSNPELLHTMLSAFLWVVWVLVFKQEVFKKWDIFISCESKTHSYPDGNPLLWITGVSKLWDPPECTDPQFHKNKFIFFRESSKHSRKSVGFIIFFKSVFSFYISLPFPVSLPCTILYQQTSSTIGGKSFFCNWWRHGSWEEHPWRMRITD